MNISIAFLVVGGLLGLAGLVLGIYGIDKSRKDHLKYGWCVRVATVLCFGGAGFVLLSRIAAAILPIE